MTTIHTISRRQFLLVAAGAAALAFSPSHRAGATVDIYQVVDGPLNLRSGPGLGYRILSVLPTGATMEIIDVGGTANGYDWVEVWVSSIDKTGYVADAFIARITTAPVNAALGVGSTAVTTAALNIRSGAGLTYPVIVTLWVGAPVTITGAPVAASGYTWYPIKTGYGTTGWVAGEYLTSGGVTTPTFAVGDAVRVVDGPLNVRADAGLAAQVINVLSVNQVLVVRDGPVIRDGYTWYKVFNYGALGWVAGEYLAYEPGGLPQEDGG